MNWFLIGNSLVNVNSIELIQRVNPNNFTVRFNSGTLITGLTFNQIEPLLILLGFN
jgi:hypothetical protein